MREDRYDSHPTTNEFEFLENQSMYCMYVCICMQECRPAHFILVSSCALAVLLMPGMYMSHELSCCSMICFQERRVHVGLAAICSTIFSNCFPAQHTYTYKIRQESPYDTIRYDTAASKQVGGAFAALDGLHGEVSKRVRDAEATDGTQSSWNDQSTTIAADFGRRRGRRERATGRRRRQWDAG